jgi:hypothetical protein
MRIEVRGTAGIQAPPGTGARPELAGAVLPKNFAPISTPSTFRGGTRVGGSDQVAGFFCSFLALAQYARALALRF